jgi:dipeptidyl aminopeptidase/acylaminoacyl peptidase
MVSRRRVLVSVIPLVGTALGPLASVVRAQAAPPSTDVFLARLSGRGALLALADSARNLTSRPGYDNQPSWAPDGRSIYLTSVRSDAQADIYRYDLGTSRESRVTTTAPESEYSATVTPDEQAISVIRVERDSTQRLWRVPLDGGASSVILPDLKPVGYHAWADDRTLVLFVLGNPNALVIASSGESRADTVARDVGRSLHRVPGTSQVSFVRKLSDEEWWIEVLDPTTRATMRRARLPRGVEDYAWTPAGVLLCGEGSRVLKWTGSAWEPLADFAAHGITNITRLAVSPDGEWLAFVGVPASR